MRALFHRQDDGEWVTAMGPSLTLSSWCDATDATIPQMMISTTTHSIHSKLDSETLRDTPRQTPRHFMPLRDRLRDTPRHSMTRSETLRDSYMHTPWHTPWDTPCTRPGSCRYYEGFVTTYALEHVLLAHSLSSLPTLPRLKDDDRW